MLTTIPMTGRTPIIWAMDRYLPSNILRLRQEVENKVKDSEFFVPESAVECLALLADAECNVDGHLYSLGGEG